MDPSPLIHRTRVRTIVDTLTIRTAALVVITVAVVLAAVAATLVHLVNPGAFDGPGDAAWWALVTLATVGYGDVVPTNGAGRAVAAIVILTSMAVFPVLTGLLTAALISRSSRDAAAVEGRREEERFAVLLERLDDLERRLAERDAGPSGGDGPP